MHVLRTCMKYTYVKVCNISMGLTSGMVEVVYTVHIRMYIRTLVISLFSLHLLFNVLMWL